MIPMRALRFALALMGLMAMIGSARADCTGPAGIAGSIAYSANYNQPAWCDGTNWNSFGGSGGGAADNLGNHTATQDLNMSGFSINSGLNATFTGLGNYGSLLTGGLTVTGQASITTISTTLIQVGNSGASCTSNLAGGVRYNSTSNTIDYCSGSAWLSLGPSATSPVSFMVTKGGTTQTVTANTVTKLTWSTEVYDTNNNFASDRFTPTIPGKYLVILNVQCADSGNNFCVSYIEKNGVSVATGAAVANNWSTPYVSTIVDMNGTTDYLEAYAKNNAGTSISGQGDSTYFSGVLLAPQGGGSGGTASPAGSANDVQFNSGGLLAADTGKFTYTTATGTLSTTTISTTRINVSPSATTVAKVYGGLGNIISSGSAVVSTSSAGSITFFSGGSQSMVINGAGVAIGASPPNAQLLVRNDSTDYTRVRVTNTNAAGGSGYYFGTDADSGYAAFIIANNTSNTAYAGANTLSVVNSRGPLAFFASTAGVLERMRIDTNGNVQLATTGTYSGASSRLTVAYTGGGMMHGIALKPGTDGTNAIDFLNAAGSIVGSVSQNATATQFNTTSDRRVKERITDTREGLQKLMELPVRDFAFQKDPSHTIVTGFIAQELDKVFPEAVTTNGDNGETALKDKDKPWSVDYGRVTPLIVKGVQDLKQESDTRYADLVTRLKAANDNAQRMGKELDELRNELQQLKKANAK
jgi:hypothetical protein